MTSAAFSLDQLKNTPLGLPIGAPVDVAAKKRMPGSLHFSIAKESSPTKHKKAAKGLLALLDKSPVSKSGGITAEISRDRDRGRV